jgi:hypothetical protein
VRQGLESTEEEIVQDTPREITLGATAEPERHDDPESDSFGTDLSAVIGSLQNSIEQLRAAARAEIGRMRAEHESERDRLQSEVEGLRARCSGQDERLRSLQSHLVSVLEDYRGELEMQTQRASSAQARMTRVQELLSDLERDPADPTPPRQAVPYQAQRRAVVVDSWQSAPSDDNERTMRIETPSTAPGAVQVSIKGVESVSAMMRARKAVEGLDSIQNIESRYVSEGTLHFTVRTQEPPQALADALTALDDPDFTLVRVTDRAIELEM